MIENLYNNVAKYALEKTRVYVEVSQQEDQAVFSIKNVSERSLAMENSSVDDLTERFIRGDSCDDRGQRSRTFDREESDESDGRQSRDHRGRRSVPRNHPFPAVSGRIGMMI